jgi:succinate dehydrogenase / fumarate reductase flavoprotein subunit
VVNGVGAKITDQMPPELLEMAQDSEWVKLIYTYYWGKEITAGRGTPNGGVFFDFSDLPRMKYFAGALKSLVMLKRWHRKNWRYQGEDMSDLNKMALKGIPWEVGLANEYSMGGVVVDAQMRTGVIGLFAAGEVTSGVFGANRTARALTEMLVQGYQAGESAATYSQEAEDAEIETDQVVAIRERILRPFKTKNGPSPGAVHAAVEAASDKGFGFVREEAGLETALGKIEGIRDKAIAQMNVRSRSRAYNYEWIEAMQVENLITCVEAGMRSALLRKESRGFHIRADFPEVDHDNWGVRIFVTNDNGKMFLTKRKPAVTTLALPRGKHESILHYAIECEMEFKNN